MTLFDAMGLGVARDLPAAVVDAPPDDDELRATFEAAWRTGDLTWKLDPHQLRIYDLFAAWNVRRQTPEYTAHVKAVDATLDDVWVEDIARRHGKTAKWIVILTMLALARPGAVYTYGTAYQKDIAEIIVPLADMLLSDGPDDLRPVYKSSQREAHEGLYFPNRGVIKLVGLDMHPNAIRGRFSDGMVLSEAGFMKRLDNLIRAVILPQFQRRPHAFLALESSTPEQLDHDFFKIAADAKLRDAYVMRTIDDNEALDPREKEKAIRMAGGRGHPTCEREYYCVPTRDPEKVIVPEFDEALHVREHARPRHARAYVAADPGSRDLFGLVFGYWDFLAAKAVIEASWARRAPSTRQVACVTAYYEWTLWGRWPPRKLASVPERRNDERDGWRELLAGIEGDAAHAADLHRMANTPVERRPSEMWIGRESPEDRFTFWNGRRWELNPALRRTDVDHRFVADLDIEHGIGFGATAKDDADAQINALRDAHGANRIVYLPTAGPVIQHVAGGRWNDKRTDWERTATLGHCDLLACMIYFWRNVQRDHNPMAPDGHAIDLEASFRPGGKPATMTREAAAMGKALARKPVKWRMRG